MALSVIGLEDARGDHVINEEKGGVLEFQAGSGLLLFTRQIGLAEKSQVSKASLHQLYYDPSDPWRVNKEGERG